MAPEAAGGDAEDRGQGSGVRGHEAEGLPGGDPHLACGHPMIRSRPLAQALRDLRLWRIPFVASQPTQVPWDGRGAKLRELEDRGLERVWRGV